MDDEKIETMKKIEEALQPYTIKEKIRLVGSLYQTLKEMDIE